jgi:glycosyltransferase involved in cell wall biosynthesis
MSPGNAVPEVVIDARWLRTGIGRYILTLLQQLQPHVPEARLTCITLPEFSETVAPYCDRVIPLQCGIYTLKEQLRLPRIASDAAVFCAPHYNVPIFRKGRMIVTIHDITHRLFPSYRRDLRSIFYASPMLRIACTRASRIIVPSDYTRRMLEEYLHADSRKIAVVPCAVDGIFRPQDPQEARNAAYADHGISQPFLLSVTSGAPHKNPATLLKAYEYLRTRRRDMPMLVLVLPKYPASASENADLCRLLTMPGVRCLTSVTDASLAALYASARMTILPSFEEGFGLPVVESMACGTPVACSNTASLPEVAADGAVYFSPGSMEEMASSIEKVLYSKTLRQQLRAAGLKRAALYTASRAASGYASVLTSVMNGAHADDLTLSAPNT